MTRKKAVKVETATEAITESSNATTESMAKPSRGTTESLRDVVIAAAREAWRTGGVSAADVEAVRASAAAESKAAARRLLASVRAPASVVESAGAAINRPVNPLDANTIHAAWRAELACLVSAA